jgi:hypothetical protein
MVLSTLLASISFLKSTGEFLALLVLGGFQYSMAVVSAINASVLSSQSDQFSNFSSQRICPAIKSVLW